MIIDAVLSVGTWVCLAVLVVAVPLALWLAWRAEDGDSGGGGPEVDLSWSPDPGGLEIDWDAELRDLLVDVR